MSVTIARDRATAVRAFAALVGEPYADAIHEEKSMRFGASSHTLSDARASFVLVQRGPVTHVLAWTSALDASHVAAWRAFDPECRRIRVGGPPDGYVRSGAGTDVDAWRAAGFVIASTHVDLAVTLREPGTTDIARAERIDDVAPWIESTFSRAWRYEVERAYACRRSLFVARDGERCVGFAAHSGNNVALGTFGPCGVDSSARGSGLGSRLARAALDDLARRGCSRAVIPWVEPSRVAFYQRLVARVEISPRTRLVLELTAAARTD